MEIDKKIILKLLNALDELKKSIKDKGVGSIDASSDVTEEEIETGNVITSPIVGTAYLAPEPGAKTFVTIGKNIKKGDTIMIVEAMKTMNHIPTNVDGVVKKILVKDGEPVEFDQPLFRINRLLAG